MNHLLCNAGDSHEISSFEMQSLIFSENNNNKNIKILSAAVVIGTLKTNVLKTDKNEQNIYIYFAVFKSFTYNFTI